MSVSEAPTWRSKRSSQQAVVTLLSYRRCWGVQHVGNLVANLYKGDRKDNACEAELVEFVDHLESKTDEHPWGPYIYMI